MTTTSQTLSRWWGCGCLAAVLVALAGLASCIGLPIAWSDYYQLEYCWFPPSGSNVEIIVSACENPSLRSLSPDGKYMIYVTNQSESWLRNLETGQIRPTLAGPNWLNSNLVLGGAVWGGAADQRGEFAIWDITNDSLTDLQWVQGIEGTTTRLEDGGQVFGPEVVKWFQDAEHVYFLEREQWAIALGPDFKNHPETNYILASRTSGQYWKPESILTFLKDNHIPYIEIGRALLSGSAGTSPDGRFIARFDGFFTAEGEKIGPMYGFTKYMEGSPVAYGWAHDGSGVYVQYDLSGGMWVIPKVQPILKINLPPEYMSPEARATAEYQLQLAQQKQARQRQGVMTWGSLAGAVVVLLGGGWLVLRRRKKKSPWMHL